MNINFDLTTQDMNQEKRDLIKKILKVDDASIQDTLNKIAKASFLEYLSMITGTGMPNRADEIRQNRLLLLIQHYFGDNLPTESEISTIFQLTQSQSKTLLANTVSRFKNTLDASLVNTMKLVIESAEISDELYLVVINSDIVKDELNKLITQKQPTYKHITKRKGSASQFEISEDSYDLLCAELN
ncbi:hypothetical protein [Providencia alcalifaciens]|uniref:hypothetical protein n=1 Tax=Providencia alcalifaciens TaxID=126385 RepID=UPI002B060C65|nr:hypothetical protein [Providencia alcalifaciens]